MSFCRRQTEIIVQIVKFINISSVVVERAVSEHSSANGSVVKHGPAYLLPTYGLYYRHIYSKYNMNRSRGGHTNFVYMKQFDSYLLVRLVPVTLQSNHYTIIEVI